MADDNEAPAQEAKPAPEVMEPPAHCDFCREGRFLACFQQCPKCHRVGEYFGR